jgi:hypothetical protein
MLVVVVGVVILLLFQVRHLAVQVVVVLVDGTAYHQQLLELVD